MVARITHSDDMLKVLNYNEQKVSEGVAELLTASGFLRDTEALTFYDKIGQFEMHTSLNERTRKNVLHVSLNFDPSEKLSNELMVEIAGEYMDRIGFRHQPYLVYRHEDAGHPHLHICSTNIRHDGSRITTHNLGRNQSEKARKELQEEYGLVQADGRRLIAAPDGTEIARKVEYGKVPTKPAIAAVLKQVLGQYQFTSLAELNAVLKNYNVVAETGSDGSRLKAFRGVIYGALDDSGKRVGAPVKASAFWFKPTLSMLERKFEEGKDKRNPHRQRLITAIDWAVLGKNMTLDKLTVALQKEQVQLVVRKGKDSRIYGLTYIDHKTKSVFNGSDLGKSYSAAGLLNRLFIKKQAALDPLSPKGKITEDELMNRKTSSQSIGNPDVPLSERSKASNDLLEKLIEPTHENGYMPFELTATQKRKKKKKGRTL